MPQIAPVRTQGQEPFRPKILIADDEQDVRDVVRQMLEPHPFEILEASNGKDVLDQIRNSHIDILILDLVMPEVEGIETLRELHTSRPDLKVLVISGAFGGSLLHCAKMLGAHAALKKPLSYDALIDNVNALLANETAS